MAKMLTLRALAADPDRFHLIDVRNADDYAAAHVKGPCISRSLHSKLGRASVA